MSETIEKTEFDESRKKYLFEMFGRVPYVRHLGLELVDLKSGEATVKLRMRDELRQPYGVLHGGATASLIDTATAFAVISHLDEDQKATTIDLNVQYLRPVTDGAIYCTARIVRAGKRIIFLSAEVTNEKGKKVATALSTYTKL